MLTEASLQAGIPRVRVRMMVSRLWTGESVIAAATLGLDYTVPNSIITTGDLGVSSPPLDDSEGIAGTTPEASGFPARAVLSFNDDNGAVVYQCHVWVIAGPAGTSRLGSDVLRKWLTVIDPAAGAFYAEPQSWDFRGLPPRL